MRILADTDAFCKLAISGILNDSLKLFGADLSECGRLPALPYMLRRGSLRRKYGPEHCDELIAMADEMPVSELCSDSLLSQLTSMRDIDPGEAQLLAKVAESGLHLITGDKRSLRTLNNLEGSSEIFAGRIIVLESILLALCEQLGPEEVRSRVQEMGTFDNVMQICFAELNSDPVTCLRSYFRSLAEEVSPLVLWHTMGAG